MEQSDHQTSQQARRMDDCTILYSFLQSPTYILSENLQKRSRTINQFAQSYSSTVTANFRLTG